MIACICCGLIEVPALLFILSLIGWLCNKIKKGCCCDCHKEHKEHKEHENHKE